MLAFIFLFCLLYLFSLLFDSDFGKSEYLRLTIIKDLHLLMMFCGINLMFARYSTTTTKVNVRKLKMDIWSKIDATIMHSKDVIADENTAPECNVDFVKPVTNMKVNVVENENENADDTEKLSFQDLISSMAGSQQQPGASLPFYFICLLHLANEKVIMNCTAG